MTYSIIIQVEGPFPEYGDGQFDTEIEARDQVAAAVKFGSYSDGDIIEIVNDATGVVVHKQTV